MMRPHTRSYLALLTILCLLTAVLLSVQAAQAREVNSVTLRNTVIPVQPGTVKSNCLIPQGNQIILLGELESNETVSAEFTLEALREVTGQLVWYVDGAVPVSAEMDFRMESGAGALDENHILTLEAGAVAVLTLTITAADAIEEDETADVRVICQDLLGTFRVALLADPVEETIPPETTLPEETEPSDPTEETDPTEPADETEPEETEPEETTVPVVPVEPVDPIDPVEPEYPVQSTPTDPTEPSDMPPETTEPELSDPESPEEPTEPSQKEMIPPEAEVVLHTLGEFSITKYLPLKVAVSGAGNRVRIGLAEETPFPAFTRYSLDGGQNWYLLYFGGMAELQWEEDLPGEEEVTWLFLLDFSQTELCPAETICLEAQVFREKVLTGIIFAETVPRAEQQRPDTIQILTPSSQDIAAQVALMLEPEETEPEESAVDQEPGGQTEPQPTEDGAETQPSAIEETEPEDSEPPAETEPAETESAADTEPSAETEPAEETEPVVETEPPAETESPEKQAVLEEAAFFTVALPAGWKECQLQYRAELLLPGTAGVPKYQEIPWEPERLHALVDETNGQLIVYLGSQTPTAGTYRLLIECTYEGICFERMQITFFINYSTRSDAQNKEVPNND